MTASSSKRRGRRHGGAPRRDHERPRAIAAVRLHRPSRHRREIRAEPHAIADAALGEDPVPHRVQGHAPRDGQSRNETSDAFQVRRQRRLSRAAALDELARAHAVRQSLGPRGAEAPRHLQRGVADQAHVEHFAARGARPAIGAVETEGAHESHALALRPQRAVGEDQRSPDDAPRGVVLQRERRRERKHDFGSPQPPSASAVCAGVAARATTSFCRRFLRPERMMRGVGHQKRSKLVRFVTSHPCRASGSPRRPDAPRTERTRSPHHPPRPAARARADARRRRGRIAPHRRGQGQFRVGLLPRSFRTRRAHSLSRLGRKSKPLLTVQQLRAPRGVMHTGGARPAGASVVRTSSRAAEMQKKVRAQRALLGDGSGGPGATAGDPAGCRSAMALGHGFPAGRDPGGLLSPVSSIGVKLDSLHHWNGTPGAPAGHPAAIEGAHVPNSAMIERRAEPSSMSFSPGTAEQAHELRPSGYYPPTTVAPGSRGNVERDLEPVRSNDGMSFADMLARNGGANPSRTQPPSRAAPLGRILPDFQLSTFEFPHAFSTHFVTHPPPPARRLTRVPPTARLPQATPPPRAPSIRAPSARPPRSATPNPRTYTRRPTRA